MLSGLKFVPRDQVATAKDESLGDSRKERQKSGLGKVKDKKKSKKRFSSSDEEGLEKIRSGSRKKKKWHDSDEDLSSHSEESNSHSDSELDVKKQKSRKRYKKSHGDRSKHEHRSGSKKKARSQRKEYSSEDESLSGSGREPNLTANDDSASQAQHLNDSARTNMGLDWMLRPKSSMKNTPVEAPCLEPEEIPAEQTKKDMSRELNPYFKDNGSGYPEELNVTNDRSKQLLSNAVVGDGGASWRLKALKRAKEQATREGRNYQEVVEERWGSAGHFAASVASRNVAPTHAHLSAINNRRRGLIHEEQKTKDEETGTNEKKLDRKSSEDVTPRNTKMRPPKVQDSLSWGKRGKKNLSTEDSALVSAAMSNFNKFSDDGRFMDQFTPKKNDSDDSSSHTKLKGSTEPDSVSVILEHGEANEVAGLVTPGMSANQLAAKAFQLRMKGKHAEAENLLKEAEKIKTAQNLHDDLSKQPIDGTTSRLILHDASGRQKKKEEDADLHLASKIMQNNKFTISGQADDEYDYDGDPRRKNRKRESGSGRKSSEIHNSANRILTQHERCNFCFENPKRPKHLVISIGNFTYLSLPQRQPIVAGHCGILTLQHESSTRTVDDDVWDEIRNFKKCLIMMFGKQEKDVIFLETVMGLAQQRRHCMVECIPIPRHIAKQAPVYFKKAIDEVEDEWSQHNAKKLIDTSERGLRNSIPKNFPYFHVEFGLNKGFAHVIDDEKEFKGNFGINVIRGILQLPAEDMHRRQREESVESQRQAMVSFARDWESFDWTKQLA